MASLRQIFGALPRPWGRQTRRRTRVPTGRTEKRNPRAVAVELSPLDASLPAETTFTVNVSPRGARVVTKQRWQPEERVLLKSVQGGLRLQARVIYCQYLPNNVFAIGLDLLAPAGEWGIPPYQEAQEARRALETCLPKA